jgi:hypothetical protein
MLPQGGGNSDEKTVKTPVLKIIQNTVVFGNAVYQISNISTLELADLTKTVSVNQKAPTWYWFVVALGVVLLPFFIGIFVLIYAGYLFWQHKNLDKSRTIEKYGLRIGMNSGDAVVLASSSKEFVLRIIVTLHNIMNSDEPKSVAFNFETLNIEDKSVSIEQAHGSTVVSGQVSGDVVNVV